MNPVPPREQKGSNDFLIWWLAPIMVLLLGLGVWSNHFQNKFHADDFETIVNNRAVHSLSAIPRFFWQPRAFNAEPENADYRPLLSTSFAIDASLTRSDNPIIYQLDTFFWFGLLIFSLYLVFRLIPGTGHQIALFAAGLFGLHPVAAETVNYVVQRGQIMGAAGVSLALALWIIWPRRLPKRLGLDLNRVPQNWWQHQIRAQGPGWERFYKGFLKLPIPFYLIPLLPALLAEPSAAVFAMLVFVYLRLYDSEEGYRRLIVPACLCAGYWLVQTAVVWFASPLFRIPFFAYWATQPWVAMRYLYRFFVPNSISADTGFKPLTHWWQPLAIAGFLGVSLLVWLALRAGGRRRWRGVAFGIWWFLIGLVPAALVPQRDAEANPRMFFAAAGLAFAVAHLGGIFFQWMSAIEMKAPLRIAALSSFGAVAVAALCVSGWMTYERNWVWETEQTLWEDVTQKNPQNGRGFIYYAAALAAAGEDAASLKSLQKAAPLSEDDGMLQLRLAMGFDRLNKDVDAEFHFRRALALVPGYSAAYSYFGQWLLSHQRAQEAFELSSKALALNASDLVSRHTLLDFYSQKSEWAMVAKLAKESLALDPDDPAGKLSLTIATASIDQVKQAEQDVKTSPTVDDYLRLSVVYYHSQRYEESVKAAREAVRLRPNLAEGYANMASALHALGRNDEAIAALREVIRLRPDMVFAKTDLEILRETQTRSLVK